MGADEGFILSDPAFEDSDGFATAYILTQAIRKIGKFDLVLCGRQAADWDAGMVGSAIAEYLDIPIVNPGQERGDPGEQAQSGAGRHERI